MKTVSKLVIVAGVIAIALSGLVVNAQTSNGKINVSELPAAAQAFIKEHFISQTVVSVTADKDLSGTEYDVVLSGGTTLEFDGNGSWEEIDGNKTALPATVVPKAIVDYTAQNYAGKAVVQIDKDKNGFDVELADNTELEFDANGKFIRVDN